MKVRLAQAAAAVACAALAAPALAQQLTGAGATFPYPIYSKWFDMFHSANPASTINYQSIGSGGGIQQLKNKTVDFGASDAPLSDAEEKTMPAPVVHIPTVGGAVVLSYNAPGVPQGLKLSGAVIADMFLGKITKWNDPRIAGLNKGVNLPGNSVAIAHRSDGSGTTFIFTSYLAAVSPEWKAKVGGAKSVQWPVGLGGKGNEGVAAIIKQTPGAIGYVELAYATENKLPYATVQNKAGKFIVPSVESITAAADGEVDDLKKDVRSLIVNSPSAKAYPIAGLTYLLVYKDLGDPTKGKVLVKFLDWAMGPGQAQAPALQYAPLPKSVLAINKGSIKSLTAGGQKIGK